jgi:hypothetical protein
MILKPGFWRFNNYSDEIYDCSNNRLSCIVTGCMEGYLGPLCETCDILGRESDSFFYKLQDYNCAQCGNIS